MTKTKKQRLKNNTKAIKKEKIEFVSGLFNNHITEMIRDDPRIMSKYSIFELREHLLKQSLTSLKIYKLKLL